MPRPGSNISVIICNQSLVRILLSVHLLPFLHVPAHILHLTAFSLKPRLFPFHPLHLVRHSSQCPGHGAGWLAGSYTQPGCTGWSTGRVGGVGPGDSMQPGPGPAEGSPRESPPPAGPHSLRQSAGLSSRGSSHEGGPERRNTTLAMILWKSVTQVVCSLFDQCSYTGMFQLLTFEHIYIWKLPTSAVC